MELLNFTSNGCRFIYDGKISKFNVFDREKQVIENRTALVIDTIIKYEASKTIDNDTIKCINIIDLNQFYEDNLLKFDYDLLYKTVMNALKIDVVHSNELAHKVNELLNKEYFIDKTKPISGIVILAKTEDDENYIGIYKDSTIKLDIDVIKEPLDFVKDKLQRDDIDKVKCAKVSDIYSIINDISIYSDFGFINYKAIEFINNLVSYTTLDDIVFDIEIFDNHLAITVKKDLGEEV